VVVVVLMPSCLVPGAGLGGGTKRNAIRLAALTW
jgi:hypothetical protein